MNEQLLLLKIEKNRTLINRILLSVEDPKLAQILIKRLAQENNKLIKQLKTI